MRRAGERGFLVLCFFLLYLATSSGDLTVDSEIRWAVAERVVDTGWLDLAPGTTNLIATGQDGRQYSLYGPGQSVCLTPFVVAGRWLAALPLPVRGTADMIGQFLASTIFFPICGAAAVLLVAAIAFEVTKDRWLARWTAVIFGAATMHWHHTVSTSEESQVAVCVLVSLWAIQRAWKHGGWRYPLLACSAMGLGLCFRLPSLMISAPMGLIAVGHDLLARSPSTERRRRLGNWALAVLVGFGPFAVLLGVLNAVRFGAPWSSGATPGHLSFESSWTLALAGMLFSPGKSVFLFNPVLLLAPFGFFGLWRSHRALALIIAATFASTLLFHAKYTYWAGDPTWGVRYLASSMGLCVLAVMPCLRSRRGGRLTASLVALSVCIQIASIVYNYGLEFFQDCRQGNIPGAYVWRPAESQLFRRFRNLGLHVAGRPDYDSIPPPTGKKGWYPSTKTRESVRRMHVVNVFPFKAREFTGSTKLFHTLLGLWIAVLVMLGLSILWWVRWARGRGPGVTHDHAEEAVQGQGRPRERLRWSEADDVE